MEMLRKLGEVSCNLSNASTIEALVMEIKAKLSELSTKSGEAIQHLQIDSGKQRSGDVSEHAIVVPYESVGGVFVEGSSPPSTQMGALTLTTPPDIITRTGGPEP